jgi:hypothetical protein
MTKFHPVKTAKAVAYYRRNGQPEHAERLERQLAAHGLCRICGRKLTDPTSVQRGIGPECRDKTLVTEPPHRVVLLPAQPWYDDHGEPQAWCSKEGCRWTWDGVGSFDHARAEHERLD